MSDEIKTDFLPEETRPGFETRVLSERGPIMNLDAFLRDCGLEPAEPAITPEEWREIGERLAEAMEEDAAKWDRVRAESAAAALTHVLD